MGGIAYISFLIKLPSYDSQSMFKIPDLGKTQVKGEKQTRSQEKKNKPLMSPDILIQPEKKFVDLLHCLDEDLGEAIKIEKMKN
jgi:hypothetical protein